MSRLPDVIFSWVVLVISSILSAWWGNRLMWFLPTIPATQEVESGRTAV
jgi:hypothetical protein